MPENVNTSVLEIDSQAIEDDSKKTMIKVDHVSMIFNMASEQLNSIKEYVIKMLKRQLFYEEFWALKDVSFEIRKGDSVGLIGMNGSGKSTMLKIIAGVLKPTKGTVETTGTIAPMIELGAGFDHDLTARENIFLNGALIGYSQEMLEERFDDIISFAGLERFVDVPIKNFSSGMLARLGFSIATIVDADILIIDEILSVGDYQFQNKCKKRIREMMDRNTTVLFVSHSIEQVKEICNKAIWIDRGHVRMIGEAEEVCDAYEDPNAKE